MRACCVGRHADVHADVHAVCVGRRVLRSSITDVGAHVMYGQSRGYR